MTGLSVLTGETVAPSQSLFTLVASDEWFAVANFRETDLAQIAIGDCATVYSMIDRGQAMRGKLSWHRRRRARRRPRQPAAFAAAGAALGELRVAQRFPVRVELEEPPAQLVRMGASAVVEIRHGPACR